MVNFNGQLVDSNTTFLNHQNRAFRFGDSLNESCRFASGKLVFWEEHYFRLVAGMRILRMKIPLKFTMEFLEQEILRTIGEKDHSDSFEVRIVVFRTNGKTLKPDDNEVSFLIEALPLDNSFYQFGEDDFEIELFKDYFSPSDLLSTIKASNNSVTIVAEIFASENDYDGCFLINTEKQVINATQGNVFVINNNSVKTSTLAGGAWNTVIRKKIIELFKNWDEYAISEESISPFELQKADEVLIADDINGIIAVTKYRKKVYQSDVAKKLLGRLNTLARLS